MQKASGQPYSTMAGFTADAIGTVTASFVDGPSTSTVHARTEWDLACRVAASRGLCRSDLLRRFLLYVCEQHLLGNTRDITEQRIGTHIFHRPTDYNPGEDNIVRSYARLLRKRLNDYFEGEGRDEPMRIIIPRGGYVPIFEPHIASPETGAELSVLQDQTEETHSPIAAEPTGVIFNPDSPGPFFPVWFWLATGVTSGALLVSVIWFFTAHLHGNEQRSAAHVVWAEMFVPDRDTLIVPADSGLGIMQNLTRRLANLEEYSNGTYLAEVKPPDGIGIGNLNDLRRQRYTSVVDLNVTTMLTRLPEFIGDRTQVRYARGITTEDLRNSNVILLGSPHTNPWVSLFEKKLNFRLEYTPEVDQSWVVNVHPAGGEQAIYRNSPDDAANHTYGSIAFLPGLGGTGHVLILQGLNMAATQAAADTLFNKHAIEPVLKRAELPGGGLRPFELLVETSSIGATAPGSQIIATRFYPQ